MGSIVVTGSSDGIRQAAESAGELGPYDVVIHNAGVGSAAARHPTAD